MTPFSIWVMGGGVQRSPPPMGYGSEKSAIDERVKQMQYIFAVNFGTLSNTINNCDYGSSTMEIHVAIPSTIFRSPVYTLVRQIYNSYKIS